MKLDRRQQILLGILGLVVLVAVFQRFGGDDAGRVAGSPRTAAGRAARGELVVDAVPLELARLDAAPQAFEVGRNPFEFARPEPPPPRPAPPTPPPVVEAPPPPPPVDVEPARPRPPSPDHLRYLGRFGPASQPIAVVISGEEILNVREGDVIEGRFVVTDIGYESVALGWVDFPDEPPTRLAVGG